MVRTTQIPSDSMVQGRRKFSRASLSAVGLPNGSLKVRLYLVSHQGAKLVTATLPSVPSEKGCPEAH